MIINNQLPSLNTEKEIKEYAYYLRLLDNNDERKSYIVDNLLSAPIEDLNKDVLNLFKPKNSTKEEIKENRDIKKIANEFSLFFSQFLNLNNDEISNIDIINSFNLFGITINDFLPKDKSNALPYKVALSKMTTPKLVKGKLFKILNQQIELDQIRNNNVDEYMSDSMYSIMTRKEKSCYEYLSNRFIEIGEEKRTLQELADNAKITRMNEFCVIKNYINSLVDDPSWGCRFITLTNKPSDLARGFNPNDKTHWDGETTPKDNADALQGLWRTIQSYANRKGIPLVGVWCREPHKKGGVHQHLLIFTKKEYLVNDSELFAMSNHLKNGYTGKYRAMKKSILNSEKTTIEKLFLDKFGYTDRSCRIDVLVKKEKTSNIVNYITKYIMKTINVKEYNETSLNDDEDIKLEKISFHRKLWNYRGYGFFGFKSNIGLWRILQRIKNISVADSILKTESILSKALSAVKENDFSEFISNVSNLKIVNKSGLNEHGEKTYSKIGIIEIEKREAINYYFFDELNDIAESNIMNHIRGFTGIHELTLPRYEIKLG